MYQYFDHNSAAPYIALAAITALGAFLSWFGFWLRRTLPPAPTATERVWTHIYEVQHYGHTELDEPWTEWLLGVHFLQSPGMIDHSHMQELLRRHGLRPHTTTTQGAMWSEAPPPNVAVFVMMGVYSAEAALVRQVSMVSLLDSLAQTIEIEKRELQRYAQESHARHARARIATQSKE